MPTHSCHPILNQYHQKLSYEIDSKQYESIDHNHDKSRHSINLLPTILSKPSSNPQSKGELEIAGYKMKLTRRETKPLVIFPTSPLPWQQLEVILVVFVPLMEDVCPASLFNYRDMTFRGIVFRERWEVGRKWKQRKDG